MNVCMYVWVYMQMQMQIQIHRWGPHVLPFLLRTQEYEEYGNPNNILL